MLPRPRAAAREKGPGESAPQQARNINTHVVNAENAENAESVVSAESAEITASAVNGGRALALRGFVPRFRSLK